MGERGGELMGATLQKSRCGKVWQVGHKTPCPTTPPPKGGGRWWGALGVPAEVGQKWGALAGPNAPETFQRGDRRGNCSFLSPEKIRRVS